MNAHPSAHGPLLAALTALLVVGGLALRHGTLLALAVPVFVFWWAETFRLAGLRAPAFEVRRQVDRRRVAAGECVNVRVDVVQRGGAAARVTIEDLLPPGASLVDGASALADCGAPDRAYGLTYRLRLPRGVHRWPAVSVSVHPFLSAGDKRTIVPCQSEVWSLPGTERLGALALAPRRTRAYAGLIRSRRGGDGLEFCDTREYVPGDEVRRIHWRASARTGRWVTSQFEQERMADVVVVLDARRKSTVDHTHRGPAETHLLFERCVTACASLCRLALSQGNRVGLLVYGRALEWTVPGYGRPHLERLLRALARAELGDKAVFEGLDLLPQRLFPSGAQLLVVSPLLAADVQPLARLRARGHALCVVSADPVAFEMRLLPAGPVTAVAAGLARLERDATLRQLRHHRIQVLDWDVATPLAPHLLRQAAAGARP